MVAGMVAACGSGTAYQNVEQFAAHYNQPLFAKNQAWQWCTGHGCREPRAAELSAEEWYRLEAGFIEKPATSAEEERQRLAEAIAWLERIVGAKTNTACMTSQEALAEALVKHALPSWIVWMKA
jgi:hypothetical protein